MERDISDILDRWAISNLKSQRIGTNENQKEFDSFNKEVQLLIQKYPDYDIEQFAKLLLDINDFIWQLESGLKSGKEKLKNHIYLLDKKNKDVLAKIGLTTILIRDFNHIRVSFKNIVNKLLKSGFQDKKQDHLSE